MNKQIYLITDGGNLRSDKKLLWAIEQSLLGAQGRIGYLQVREQVVGQGFAPASEDDLRALVLELKPLCKAYGAKLLINSRLDLALEFDLDGLHIGARSDVSLEMARARLADDKLLGYSAHNREDLAFCFASGADYALLSPVFDPLSKKATRKALGPGELSHITSEFNGQKIFALGGITQSNLAEVAGEIAGVALISSILLAADPREAAEKFASRLSS